MCEVEILELSTVKDSDSQFALSSSSIAVTRSRTKNAFSIKFPRLGCRTFEGTIKWILLVVTWDFPRLRLLNLPGSPTKKFVSGVSPDKETKGCFFSSLTPFSKSLIWNSQISTRAAFSSVKRTVLVPLAANQKHYFLLRLGSIEGIFYVWRNVPSCLSLSASYLSAEKIPQGFWIEQITVM